MAWLPLLPNKLQTDLGTTSSKDKTYLYTHTHHIKHGSKQISMVMNDLRNKETQRGRVRGELALRSVMSRGGHVL